MTTEKGHPLGVHRSVTPPGVLPQAADRLDPSLPIRSTEIGVDVEWLNVDAASFAEFTQRAAESGRGHGNGAIIDVHAAPSGTCSTFALLLDPRAFHLVDAPAPREDTPMRTELCERLGIAL